MKNKSRFRSLGKGDILIPILTAVLAAFGVVSVYSASSYSAEVQYGDGFYFMKKQLVGFVLGLIAMIAVSFLDYERLKSKKVRWISVVVSIILLALVFVPGLGKSNYGATRWIAVGGITVQPSEIAKY